MSHVVGISSVVTCAAGGARWRQARGEKGKPTCPSPKLRPTRLATSCALAIGQRAKKLPGVRFAVGGRHPRAIEPATEVVLVARRSWGREAKIVAGGTAGGGETPHITPAVRRVLLAPPLSIGASPPHHPPPV